MTEVNVKINWNKLKYWPDSEKIYFTYSDIEKFPEWPDGPLIEIIDGELYMVPSPTPFHQTIAGNVYSLLRDYVKKNRLGQVFMAPLDVVLAEKDVVDPDVFFIPNTKKNIVHETRIEGIPDLVVEVLSKNRDRDVVKKRALYERFGIPEYWIIDPVNRTVTVHQYNKDQRTYPPGTLHKSGQEFTGRVLPNLRLPVSALFEI